MGSGRVGAAGRARLRTFWQSHPPGQRRQHAAQELDVFPHRGATAEGILEHPARAPGPGVLPHAGVFAACQRRAAAGEPPSGTRDGSGCGGRCRRRGRALPAPSTHSHSWRATSLNAARSSACASPVSRTTPTTGSRGSWFHRASSAARARSTSCRGDRQPGGGWWWSAAAAAAAAGAVPVGQGSRGGAVGRADGAEGSVMDGTL